MYKCSYLLTYLLRLPVYTFLQTESRSTMGGFSGGQRGSCPLANSLSTVVLPMPILRKSYNALHHFIPTLKTVM